MLLGPLCRPCPQPKLNHFYTSFYTLDPQLLSTINICLCRCMGGQHCAPGHNLEAGQ